MTSPSARSAPFAPRAIAIAVRLPAWMPRIWSFATSRLRRAAAWGAQRNVDAVDGLDAHLLRDIGARDWGAAREARHAHEVMRLRFDAEFRG